MAVEINVPLGDRSYPIFIGANCLDSVGQRLVSISFPKRVAVISNPTVDGIYGDTVEQSLVASGYSVKRHNVPDGEEYKNLKSLEEIFDFLIKNSFDRGAGIVALGGGVIGDMAGFAAATYLRGIPYVQIPTTLLAQVDSSVGGKTAVNHALGKNLIGAFYQPEMVLIDIDTLSTLDSRNVSAGLAEVVKYGVISDHDFFCWLEGNVNKLKSRNPESLIYAIKKACQIKSDIVEVDEKEGSVRAFLNYGHTFGHAIESLCGYGRWKHGEAISVGMVVAANISHKLQSCSLQDVQRLVHLLEALDLPVSPPDYRLEEYIESMKRDKKVRNGKLTLVLNRGLGNAELKQIDNLDEIFSEALSFDGVKNNE